MSEVLRNRGYVPEIEKILKGTDDRERMAALLAPYHEKDIAEALTLLSEKERRDIYYLLEPRKAARIFSFFDEPELYLKEMEPERIGQILSELDSDDAIDLLEFLDEETKKKVAAYLDVDAGEDIRLIQSFKEDEIGSEMTTNFIRISKGLSIPEAMQELVRQAGENDNISTLYVLDEQERFYGAIDLKDLIIARKYQDLDKIISTSYPFFYGHEKISDCVEKMKDYAEDSLPVLSEDLKLLGVITAHDVVEVVDDELGEDYAKLAGLSAEEDLRETVRMSMRKRLPWLVFLLVLGMGVSAVVGVFEGVAAMLPVLVGFQSLILDMAGNVGTQSLAVTIRVLMDENLHKRDKLFLAVRELKVGFLNGILLGGFAFLLVAGYLVFVKNHGSFYAFRISACVGIALLVAMMISGLVGTLIPMFFHRIKIDPAVASGPLITTVNDLIAVITYYGLAYLLLIQVAHMAT